MCSNCMRFDVLPVINIVTHTNLARQRLGKNIPKVTLLETEESLKAGEVHC
jgi:hypothetical protein